MPTITCLKCGRDFFVRPYRIRDGATYCTFACFEADHGRRFLAKVARTPNGCWEWTGSIDPRGYGRLMTNGHRLAHRYAYALYKGPIPDGLHVCHRCDNRRCVNPDHLWLGTNADNVADRQKKGRAPKGADRPGAKLSAKAIATIRRLRLAGLSYDKIAKRLDVSHPTVWNAVNGKTWRHVKVPQ